MVQQQFEILEARISYMIQRIKSLRLEKIELQAEIDRQGREFHQLKEERYMVRNRVGKILETLNHVGGKDAQR